MLADAGETGEPFLLEQIISQVLHPVHFVGSKTMAGGFPPGNRDLRSLFFIDHGLKSSKLRRCPRSKSVAGKFCDSDPVFKKDSSTPSGISAKIDLPSAGRAEIHIIGAYFLQPLVQVIQNRDRHINGTARATGLGILYKSFFHCHVP